MSETVASAGSTVARRQLGRELSILRKSLVPAISQVKASREMGWSQAKLHRLEAGKPEVTILRRDIRDLCEMYGASSARAAKLMAIYEQTQLAGPWASRYGEIPDWFQLYVELEQAASGLREYHTELITGVFQIREYATELVRLDLEGRNTDATADVIAERVEIRLKRSELLTRELPAAPTFDIVLNEAIIRRPVGGPHVMARQLRHLAEVSELPNVTLRIVPFSAGLHRAALAAGAFVILDFAANEEPTTVYSEGLTGAAYLDQDNETAAYIWAFDGLTKSSLDASASRDLVITASKEYER
ncbi:helix-turn-helix domain-containing protein [Actinocatenispora rupis]|uniref:Transcriptional regulator n=1 Tax=Actinocatenispora rupis TaxID=519421 RepID=A0A8J3IZ59_9ACTN|nr:helix-turn-helix transcriptional regulator [Actinocatenispora rupis]GID11505.1 transcriptional regulator [Actinocatenispora rupis]